MWTGIAATRKSVRAMTSWRCWRIWTSCPRATGWTHDPYGAEIIDGRMIGRGTSDDKGPGVAALFGMKAIMDAGIPLRRRCRLILGCDEECGIEGLKYYEKKVGLPDMGFSPDANFPLINTEKGIMQLTLHAPMADDRLLEVGIRNALQHRSESGDGGSGGRLARSGLPMRLMSMTRIPKLETELSDGNTRLAVTGVAAHASCPEKGKNAAKMLIAVLNKLGHRRCADCAAG